MKTCPRCGCLMLRGNTDRFTCPKCGKSVRAGKLKVGPLAGAGIILAAGVLFIAGLAIFGKPRRSPGRLEAAPKPRPAARARPTSDPGFGDPSKIWTVKRGTFAAVSEDLLDRALAIVESGDRAAMARLMEGGGVFVLKVGLRVYVTDFWIFSSKIKIRPVGEAVEFWTIDRAVR